MSLFADSEGPLSENAQNTFSHGPNHIILDLVEHELLQ